MKNIKQGITWVSCTHYKWLITINSIGFYAHLHVLAIIIYKKQKTHLGFNGYNGTNYKES